MMEIDLNKFRTSVRVVLDHLVTMETATEEYCTLKGFLQKQHCSSKEIEGVLNIISSKLLKPDLTLIIATAFPEYILLLVTICIPNDQKLPSSELEFAEYQRNCVILAKLIHISEDVKRYATSYFLGKPAPFQIPDTASDISQSKKTKMNENKSIAELLETLPLLKCCYQLLCADPAFFKDCWDWSEFIREYLSKPMVQDIQKLYINHIISILTNMNATQLKRLNKDISINAYLEFEREQQLQCVPRSSTSPSHSTDTNNCISLNLKSDIVTNIEGVLLPIFNKVNYKFYNETEMSHGEKIVKVDSTKVNLRSIALGISSAKPICLSGPVGCGKTTLIEYLARKTGRTQPKQNEIKLHIIETNEYRANGKENIHKDLISSRLETNASKKRKTLSPDLVEEMIGILEKQEKSRMVNNSNGFLRIQLGDQTDSKMLLGQYRCTDVPGEFVWSPGVLTQAVMNGYWLLLEDLDSATQDTFTILSNLLENNFLSVPGFRENIKIEPGFQLFVTVRTNKSTLSNNTQKSLYTLLEKYLYTINILPLSRNELCKVVSCNYPKLATISNRIVDVFLTFSSGDHTSADNLRQQEIFASEKADTTEPYVALPFEQVTSNVINSGRLVSTRDLIKLCQRSNPMFSVTSSECAYFVFQNAVDIFCSYLPQGKEKTKLICSIGAKLGIIRSRCEFLANEYKPQVIFDREGIKAGRAELNIKFTLGTDFAILDSSDDLDTCAQKRIKLSKDSERVASQVTPKGPCATFSFTRLASCLLERVAVSVAHEEPVLLVGETGVGKTSAVQYLAQRTHHKLVVVNMNNQSDVSDLLGGFKPVDLRYVVTPLRNEFELLFRRTFNLAKNEAFLNKFAICYNQGNYAVIIKLMLKVVSSVFEKATQNMLRPKELEYLPRWQDLRIKLLKLNAQLAKSINISFAFIPGSLVNCIQNGDWILLDEINLASTETLECLSTILEPDGSVVLLEKGDMTPVKRHPEFRIFACMNPNTDIGKKDLSVSIRNRFTEFFVDELTTEADLALLISDYLANTGIQNKSVSNIVKLYKKLTELSKLELNDGLGNRPVFSLRTLCRALRICSKNLCGSIDRNLYESFCMSFLTQLDPGSHQLVLELIKQLLLSNPKAILMQSIPKPGENYLNFEGYWIEQGSRVLQDCEHYILTESVRSNLKDLARIISIGKLPILLQGPTSAGKTSLIEYVAKRSGNHCVRINNHEHTDLQEYIGTYVADCSGKLIFREGVLVQAMRNGYWIILDELNLASTDILEALNRVLDDNRELFIPETQTLVRAHPNFMLFATQNPPGLYGGRKTLSRAFKNRFIELHFAEIPRQELELILEQRCKIPQSYAKKMVLCMSELQKNRKTTTAKNVFTLRDLFRWGNRYTYADKKLLEDGKYDWNQHLIEEGYLVLSAKVRTQAEIEIIEEALYHNFKKRIDLACLFDAYSNKISPVTQDILYALKTFKERTDIVWTRPMTRMAVLAAKALQFNEPVLLVGPTGCGKTTVCQVLASLHGVKLRILNCHMHTEGADFLGGLRPCRQQSIEQTNKLFEWADGPLIHAMQEGSYFMADEISLAEDSVLERLNCVLEPERTVLLAEKGGIVGEGSEGIEQEFLVQAANGFQFLATMNPGGDFGKKELSPALRNRFTEIWCQPSDSREDLIHIAYNYILQSNSFEGEDDILKVATYIVDIVFFIRDHIDKFKYSVRDILAWAQYMVNNKNLNFAGRAIFGLETVFLDALEMLPFESPEALELLKRKIIEYATKQSEILMNTKFTWEELLEQRGTEVVLQDNGFGIKPFFVETNEIHQDKNFLFDVPTTKKNLFRLLSALSLRKPVLLEGPPGVGKTSIVESIAQTIGYQIVRINLCEHTDLADLFGTDLPVEDNALNAYSTAEEASVSDTKIGSFVWRDGPLLAALKAPNTWILLDELNLAPQSVLEGLNAILDHRGEVFIPELNKTFQLNQKTRIFACQNPLRQGGGRKGLPQSFLNRFNKAYLRNLTNDDMLYVINRKYSQYFEQLQSSFLVILKNAVVQDIEHYSLFELSQKMDLLKFTSADSNRNNKTFFVFDLSERMVKFSESLDRGITNMEFGYQGGPYEINLRDILRWCDLLIHPETGFISKSQHEECTDPTISTQLFEKQFQKFLLTLYERMKLVYCQRMRSSHDKLFIRNIFSTVFNCDANHLNALSEDVALYWTDEKIYLNDIVLQRTSELTSSSLRSIKPKSQAPILLASQREYLKNLIECVHMDKPVILCGPTDAGKTKLINILCSLSNQLCHTDSIDDSVTGSFQQIDLNRHLESISRNVENYLYIYIQNEILCDNFRANLADLLKAWYNYNKLTKEKPKLDNFSTITSEELHTFRKRIQLLNIVIEQLSHSYHLAPSTKSIPTPVLKTNITKLEELAHLLNSLKNKIQTAESLNTGGSFEWVDSKIVQALKLGHYINLEHVNLCSSAVLDRLNPVFEPNGRLMISEKGVTIQDTAEIVDKAENFRAFLTLDPKNGELSRAMRNRCVELALTKETAYDVDDMRHIIHISGVAHIAAVNCILQIHERIVELTEINPYTISHLTQFAGLTAAYERIGYALDRAIYISGMEVYVYSASMDLLGYGLAFYQNKLREIVLEETKRFTAESLNNPNDQKLTNIILNCENINTTTLIKLQLEPLKILIKHENIETAQSILSQFFSAFKTYKFKSISIKNLIKFYVYMLYECSSMEDIKLRNGYITDLLSIQSSSLQKLSHNFYNNIQYCQESLELILPPALPWNTKLFPRLRDYSACEFMSSTIQRAYSLSIQLLAHLIISEAPVIEYQTLKLQDISAFNYSQAISEGTIVDKLKNSFLQNFATFIRSLEKVINTDLKEATKGVDLQTYTETITNFLWFNRLLKSSEQKLFKANEINADVFDKLLLHFKWLEKHLLRMLFKMIPNYQFNKDFENSLHKLNTFISNRKQPLNLLRKTYTKRFTDFQPFYMEDQVLLHSMTQNLESALSVIPSYGSYPPEIVLKKFAVQKTPEAAKCRARLRQLATGTKYNYNFKDSDIVTANGDYLPDDLKMALQKFVTSNRDLKNSNANTFESCFDVDDFRTDLNTIQQALNSEEFTDKPKELELAMLPLREYFLNKCMAAILISPQQEYISNEQILNKSYYEAIPSLHIETLQLLEILKAPGYQNFINLWITLSKHLENVTSAEEFDNLMTCLGGNYCSISSFKRLIDNAVIHLQLNDLAQRSECTQVLHCSDDITSAYNYNGPALIQLLRMLLCNHDGVLKTVPLQELTEWKHSLQSMRQLVWHNSFLMCSNFSLRLRNRNAVQLDAKKLLKEVNCVQKLCGTSETENVTDYNDEAFKKLIQALTSAISTLTNDQINDELRVHTSILYRRNQYDIALWNALIGSIEVCLLNFTPLIDPVEKNRLKSIYVIEDINCLTTLTTVYDFMRIIMKYKHFGEELYASFVNRIEVLNGRQEKFSKKLALRPEQCLYSSLVQDIKHFLLTNCEPQALLKLIENARDCWSSLHNSKFVDFNNLKSCSETLNKIELWLTNTRHFLYHVLKRYVDYYQDFVQPLECSLNRIRSGFEGFKVILIQLKEAFAISSTKISRTQIMNIDNGGKLHQLLADIAQFPTTRTLELYDIKSSSDIRQNSSPIVNILSRIEGSEYDFFRLIKIKITELSNSASVSCNLSENVFRDFDFAFNVSNQIWQEEEERYRRKKAEDESLYVTKIKCQTEDEELLELQEIDEIFPTNVQEDFGDFVQEYTLEKVMKFKDKQKQKTSRQNRIIRDEDYAFLVENFIKILKRYTHVYYRTALNPEKNENNHLQIIEPFKERLSVFIKIFAHYQKSLNEWLDEECYNSFSLAIGLQQQLLNDLTLPERNEDCYNFYKDSNIPEIVSCTDILQRIEERVQIQLNLYPEHAGLLDILRVIERIRGLPSTSPVVRFNTGFQILRQKISLWNEVAHKNNNLRTEETEVAEYVQKWTKLELQFWRNCLSQVSKQVEVQAFRYWFFMYNLLQQYLKDNAIENSYTDINSAEKRFVERESLDKTDEVEKKTEVEVHDIIRILRTFVESSNYGDFHVRLELIQSFELYLHNMEQNSLQIEEKRRILIAGLHNLQIYFSQFAQEIEDTKKAMRTPIEKKLKELVKIESYNKDLSYFSMRNNIARVHRNLNKFLKEYRLQLQQKIIPVFQPKDATVRDYNFENDKGKDTDYEWQFKHNFIDVKSFIAPQNLRLKFANNLHCVNDNDVVTATSDATLLQKVGTYFSKSRNIVEEIVTNAIYPKLVHALENLFCQQLERCNQLRKMEVDRSRERSQQKLEAKQILQQKRKALSDLFKTLAQLGISYKKGLLELTLRAEFEDFTLPPFCVQTMLNTKKDKDMYSKLTENIDKYFAKCAFKLRLLQNAALSSSLADLGQPNIERIKGTAVEMFLLAQNQRHLLATSTKDIYDLRQLIQNLRKLAEISASKTLKESHLEFLKLQNIFDVLKESFSRIRYVFEQFDYLLACVPEKQDEENHVLSQPNSINKGSLLKGSEEFVAISKYSNDILKAAKNSLTDMIRNESEFISFDKLDGYHGTHKKIIDDIKKIQECCRNSDGEYLPICRCLDDLLNYIKEKTVADFKCAETVTVSFSNTEKELENVIHAVLLAMQKLYTKYRQQLEKTELRNEPHEPVSEEGVGNDDDDDDDIIQSQHLKKRLLDELVADSETLNLDCIISKMSNVLLSLKHAPSSDEKLLYMLKVTSIIPLLEQYELLNEYYLYQQLSAHKITVKMLSTMLTVFLEIITKGFCVPADLMQDEEGEAKKESNKEGQGFGLEDGTGEKDASDKIDSEDQLDDAKRPEDREKEDDGKENNDCKEEKGIEMSEDFEGKMQDVDKPEDDDDNAESEEEENLDKEMGETEEGADKLDEQIWGDDEETEKENDEEKENDMEEEDSGKGSKDESDSHNDLNSKNDKSANEPDEHNKDALDATNEPNNKKNQEKDIDNLKDTEIDEDQVNPYHNELEDPPEPEEMDLTNMDNADEQEEDVNEQPDNNPFDIDEMRENMKTAEETNEEEEEKKADNEKVTGGDEETSSDSDEEEEQEAGKERVEDKEMSADPQDPADDLQEKAEEEEEQEDEVDTQKHGSLEDVEDEEKPDENRLEKSEEYKESKDKKSTEENIQSMPETENMSSADQVQNNEDHENVKQEQKLDDQDTGEERDGVGQAENEMTDNGHQGISESKETMAHDEPKAEGKTDEKRKQGRTDEDRTLGEAEKNQIKQLKTVDKLRDTKDTDEDTETPEEMEVESEEYQHVKEPKSSDKTTLDNATEEQTKQVQNLEEDENKEDNMNEEECTEELSDTKETPDQTEENNPEEILAEKIDQKSEKSSKSEKTKERGEAKEEQMEIDGEIVATATVPRSNETTAHCIRDILVENATNAQELGTLETLELRKMYQQQLINNKIVNNPEHDAYDQWQNISNRMLQNARELCEQLRLILEPTKCTRLKGDYRTGRRINMKKIIPYIASQFRKDKIWLRRTKPAQRDYKITIAIDDSKSMHHNNSKTLTLEAISLVAQALTLLESGRLSIVSFGETSKIVLHHTEQLDGPKLVNALTFAQEKTRIAELLDFVRIINSEEGSLGSDNGIFENLLLILSDGRNIFSEGKMKVKNSIKLARLQRMFLVYIIIDNPENKNSILDIQAMEVLPDKRINIKCYLDDFPFPYYVIVRDLNQLPLVLSEAMRQWFELVNSEQN